MSRCEICGNRECTCGNAQRTQEESLDVLLRIEALLEELVAAHRVCAKRYVSKMLSKACTLPLLHDGRCGKAKP